MNEQDILKIISESFDEEVFSSSDNTEFGCITYIEGKADFLKSVEYKLSKLFKENDLSTI